MDQTLIKICQQLAQQGKRPSVGLLKAKAPKQYHLSDLVAAVQYWKANPDMELTESQEDNESKSSNKSHSEMSKAELIEKVQQLEDKLQRLEALVNVLHTKLK
ncbi:hypothetical protein KIH87_04880 [Paraneptunicella aestuarii]|uniref:hypothetical protein n=1 Tax=Paraneptunicella aestuarii TaxID=2831148 RepID=UPI001E5DEDF8|nr:hypothetical protein [Paraneptunicella aestuarii]UAA39696.1 hypothetical protein KIH87_04880 [Paraneptunicella aestuarii]